MSKAAELIKAIGNIKKPTKLLKFGSSGRPKWVDFRLSEDAKTVLWESKSKKEDQTRSTLHRAPGLLARVSYRVSPVHFLLSPDHLYYTDSVRAENREIQEKSQTRP